MQVANELAKYAYPYADEIELDPAAQSACSVLGLDTPIATLMDAPVRAAVTHAILFGFEESHGALPHRFIRLRRRSDSSTSTQSDGHALGRIRVDQEQLASFFDSADPKDKFSASATPQGVSTLLASMEQHHESLASPVASRPVVLFTVGALLSNLIESGEHPPKIEIVQRMQNRKLATAIRAEGLSFSARLPNQADSGPRILETELISVLNLNWFDSITVTPDGKSILFIAR